MLYWKSLNCERIGKKWIYIIAWARSDGHAAFYVHAYCQCAGFAILFSYWIDEYVKKGQFFCVQLIEETIPKSQNAILSVWPDDVSWQVTASNPQILHSIQLARYFYEISRWFLFCFQIVSYLCIPNFTLSATQWIEKTNAIGVISKAGLYGGTYARNESKEPSRWSRTVNNKKIYGHSKDTTV